MDEFQVAATPAAARQLNALPERIQSEFREAFQLLAQSPFRARPGLDVEKMSGTETCKLRRGHYRGIFRVDGREIVFLRFGHRSTVYRA